MSSPTSKLLCAAAERERLREVVHREEVQRLAAAGLGADCRQRAADAFVGLFESFLIADDADRRYDMDARQVQALDDVVRVIDAQRQDPRWPDIALDRRLLSNHQAVRVLRERYEVRGDEADLARALAFAEEAVGLARPARQRVPTALPSALRDLGEQLSAEFDRNGQRERIDRAVDLLREANAMEEAPPPDDHRSAAESLAATLLLRAKAFGGTADLNEAVQVLERTIRVRPASAGALDALGCVLIARAEQTESSVDLDAAVDALERATALAPHSPWFRANLAVALGARFTTRGDRQDSRRAGALLDQALASIPEGAPDRLRILQNAGARNAAEPSATDLVAQARAIVAATPAGARARPARLGALAGRLIDAFETSLEPATLAEALTVSEEGLRIAGHSSVDRPSLLGGLAYALLLRFAVEGKDNDLDGAITLAQEAVGSAPAVSPERAGFAPVRPRPSGSSTSPDWASLPSSTTVPRSGVEAPRGAVTARSCGRGASAARSRATTSGIGGRWPSRFEVARHTSCAWFPTSPLLRSDDREHRRQSRHQGGRALGRPAPLTRFRVLGARSRRMDLGAAAVGHSHHRPRGRALEPGPGRAQHRRAPRRRHLRLRRRAIRAHGAEGAAGVLALPSAHRDGGPSPQTLRS